MLIVDGNNLLHRVADRVGYGVHPVRELYSRFCSPPETTIIVWDGPYANKRRQEIYPRYKENRRPKEESKFKFFEIAKGVLRFAPIIQIEIPGWEADDIIGTLVNRLHHKQTLTVETNDGDYWQHKDKCKLPLVTKKWRHMSADECLLYKSLVGDAKDNIAGVKAFGTGSWDTLTDESKRLITEGILENDFKKFSSANWPTRVKVTPQTLKDAQLYWRLNSWWMVSDKEIDDHTFNGKANIAAAEHFMKEFLI